MSEFPDPYEGMTPDELDRHFASVLAAKAAEIERLREIERLARSCPYWRHAARCQPFRNDLETECSCGLTALLAALPTPRGETP